MKLAERMGRLGTETAFEVLAKARALEAQGKDIVHLEIGEPDFDTPGNIINAAKQAIDDGMTHYGPSPGLPDVRAGIAEETAVTRNIPVTADNVVFTPGGKPIMFFVIMALIDYGDEVLYPNPGFPIYESMINFSGGVPIPMQLHEETEFGVDLDEVRSKVSSKTKMMIVNSPNNPCGSVLSHENLKGLAELAVENDIIILTDEIYRRFMFEGAFESITQFPGTLDRTIILDGFSKTYAMTGWRAGYGVMPEPLVEPISRLVTNSVSCTAAFTQVACLEALQGPQEDAEGMVAEFKKRRELIVNGLNSIKGIRCVMPKGAFYVFPNIEDTGMTSRQFADGLLEEGGVAALAGECFGEFGKGFLRFSFANSAENIEKALERTNDYVNKNT